MWFPFALLALLFWSGSDLFSKLGSPERDRLSPLKLLSAVGLVMGVHAGLTILGGVSITFRDVLTYLPASALYILSMAFGYLSLRYIELSCSSPICNCSGAVAAVFCFIFLSDPPTPLMIVGVLLVAAGLLLLGYVERREAPGAKELRRSGARSYPVTVLGLLLPLLYCLIDALGTFFDCVILREEPTGSFLDSLFPVPLAEDVANVCYELTFLAVGLVAALYVFGIKKEKLLPKADGAKLIGGVFETAGQFFYIYAIGNTASAGLAAAVISAYSALSVVWSRVFLKEKLSPLHYVAIAVAIGGVVLMGFLDP